jgi:MFS transporter, PAT family, beta-lactamase induction signal transducer AmpG
VNEALVEPGNRPRSRLAGWWQAVLVYRQPRMLSMLFLGFSAGLPFMLVFQTLSFWLRQIGIERATIGMLSWVGIAYTFKFIWAPVVDRTPLPILDRLLGRRRSWMLIAQIGIAIGLVNIAMSDPAQGVLHVALFALFVAFCSATQDIAIDAWRIESAPVDQQGAMAAAYQLGYRISIMVGSAGALWIAADFGWAISYATMAAMIGIGVITTLLVKEPERLVPRDSVVREQRAIEWLQRNAHLPETLRRAGAWFIGAVVCPLVDIFARYGLRLALVIFAFIGTYRLTDFVMGSMANPFYVDLGFTLKQVAAIAKGYGVAMSIVGILVGGIAVAKLGRTRSLILGSVLIICSNLAFAIFAAMGKPSLVGLAAVISLDNLALGVHGTALIAFMSGLTSASYTATQYALLSSLYALPGKLLMGTSGFVVDAIDYPAFFVYTAALSLPGLAILWWLVRRGGPLLRS